MPPTATAQDPPATRPAKNSSQALDLKQHNIAWEEFEIDVHLIDARPDQPRQIFDQDKLRELATNISQIGLQQRILVERFGNRYQLIAGERRWRAFLLLERKMIPARVIKATDEQIELICLSENLQREGLTVIEEAAAYQTAISRLKCTQSQLAKKLGLSQGQISNRIRILKTPPSVQAAIISGEIDTSVAREIAAWCDYPSVVAEIEAAVVSHQENQQLTGEKLTNDILLDIHNRAIRKHSRPVGQVCNENGKQVIVDLAKKSVAEFEKQLQIRDVPHYVGGGTSRRAFNLTLWGELAEVVKPPKHISVTDPAPDVKPFEHLDAEDSPEPSTSQAKASKAEREAAIISQRAFELEEARQYYLASWYWQVVVDWLPECGASFLWRYFTWFASQYRYEEDVITSDNLARIVEECGGKPVAGEDGELNLLASTVDCDGEKFAVKLLQFWTAEEAKSPFLFSDRMDVLRQIVQELDIDLATHWTVDHRFLNLHDLPELVALLVEWKRKGPGPSITDRDAMITWILEENERKPFSAPKCLTKLKFPKR